MQYSIKALSDGVAAAKAATQKAIADANVSGKAAVLALAEKFVANGGKPIASEETILLSGAAFQASRYGNVLSELALMAGDAIEESELTQEAVTLIQGAGKISSYKRTVQIA